MGIPMYREPSSTEASKSQPLKDPTTAGRSSIRRQPTLRRSSRYGGGPTLRGAHHSHHPHRLVRPPFQDSMTSNSILNRRSIGDILAREARVLGYPMASPLDENPFDDSLDAHRREGQRLLADAARHGQPGRRLRIPRETTTLSELINRQSPGDGPGSQQQQQQQQQSTSEHPPFSRRFAPAVAYHNAISYPSNDFNDIGRMASSTPPASQRVPHLRRVVEQSINNLSRVGRESAIDGLGDRERSLSLGVGDDDEEDEDDHAHDAWDTLLTTITPDANLPSNESSFASASAAALNPSRHGTAADSASTAAQTFPLTASLSNGRDREATRMVLHPYPEFLNPCDYPTSSDSESDTELNLEESHRSRRRRRTPHQSSVDTLRQSHDLNSTMSSQPPPISTFSFSFYDSTSDPDFQQMQAILDRLARREEIPEHWWAAAGLSRTVGRRLGAGDETPES